MQRREFLTRAGLATAGGIVGGLTLVPEWLFAKEPERKQLGTLKIGNQFYPLLEMFTADNDTSHVVTYNRGFIYWEDFFSNSENANTAKDPDMIALYAEYFASGQDLVIFQNLKQKGQTVEGHLRLQRREGDVDYRDLYLRNTFRVPLFGDYGQAPAIKEYGGERFAYYTIELGQDGQPLRDENDNIKLGRPVVVLDKADLGQAIVATGGPLPGSTLAFTCNKGEAWDIGVFWVPSEEKIRELGLLPEWFSPHGLYLKLEAKTTRYPDHYFVAELARAS